MRTGAAVVVMLVAVTGSSAAPSRATAQQAGPRVTFFGDSVAGSIAYVSQAREILGDGLDLRLELAPCRRVASLSCPYMGTRPPSVLDVVQASAPADLGDIVVVDVGYNETALNYGSAMATVLQALLARGVDHVVWVELRRQTDNYREIDDTIEAQARRFPQVQVADWDAASKGHDDWFNDDGLHLKAAGAVGLALFVRPFVFAACGSRVSARDGAARTGSEEHAAAVASRQRLLSGASSRACPAPGAGPRRSCSCTAGSGTDT